MKCKYHINIYISSLGLLQNNSPCRSTAYLKSILLNSSPNNKPHPSDPDSVLVVGSHRLNFVLGEYKVMSVAALKGVTSEPDSRGTIDLMKNGRPVYKHECKPLYIYYVVHEVRDGDSG